MATDNEYEDMQQKLLDIRNKFWEDFSKLCNKARQDGIDVIKKFDVNHDDELSVFEMELSESTSFYGRKDDV